MILHLHPPQSKAKLAAKVLSPRDGLRNPRIPVNPSRSPKRSTSFRMLFPMHFWCLSIVPADLLSIVIRTIILVRRNRLLQRRLNALRAETRRFLRSVLNNPEEQQRRSQVPSEDSSSTKKVVSLSPLLDANPTGNSFHGIIPTRDHINDESSSSDKSEDSSRSECWFFSVPGDW